MTLKIKNVALAVVLLVGVSGQGMQAMKPPVLQRPKSMDQELLKKEFNRPITFDKSKMPTLNSSKRQQKKNDPNEKSVLNGQKQEKSDDKPEPQKPKQDDTKPSVLGSKQKFQRSLGFSDFKPSAPKSTMQPKQPDAKPNESKPPVSEVKSETKLDQPKPEEKNESKKPDAKTENSKMPSAKTNDPVTQGSWFGGTKVGKWFGKKVDNVVLGAKNVGLDIKAGYHDLAAKMPGTNTAEHETASKQATDAKDGLNKKAAKAANKENAAVIREKKNAVKEADRNLAKANKGGDQTAITAAKEKLKNAHSDLKAAKEKPITKEDVAEKGKSSLGYAVGGAALLGIAGTVGGIIGTSGDGGGGASVSQTVTLDTETSSDDSGTATTAETSQPQNADGSMESSDSGAQTTAATTQTPVTTTPTPDTTTTSTPPVPTA